MKVSVSVVPFLVCLALAAPRGMERQSTPTVAGDALQTWIAQRAIAVRSTDPMDEDFSDLEPLMEAIGSARVVQLGEPSHGAGSCFAAKARLIKFLHRRMGFDMVAWESGLYDVRLTQAAMRGGGDPVVAAQRGILMVWSNAEEARPLFDYAKASQATARPLEMVGFDMNVSAPGTDEQFAADLRSFGAALRDSVRRRAVTMVAARTISTYERLHAHLVARRRRGAEASKAGLNGKALDDALTLWEHEEGEKQRPSRGDFDDFLGAVDGLLTAIAGNRAAFEEVHGAKEVGFIEHAIENMRGRGASVYDSERVDSPPPDVRTTNDWNRRDALMARNLRWLMEAYPGRKVIVWAHNAHVMHAYFAANWGGVHAEPQPNGMKPAGAFLKEWLKDDMYSIAMTTYDGEEAWANFQRRGPISPAPEGSLETRLHRLGKPQVFLDLRAARDKNGHPVRTPQSIRISGFGPPTSPFGNDLVPDATTAFDAIFYIDHTAPANPICRGRCTGSPPR